MLFDGRARYCEKMSRLLLSSCASLRQARFPLPRTAKSLSSTHHVSEELILPMQVMTSLLLVAVLSLCDLFELQSMPTIVSGKIGVRDVAFVR